VLNPVADVISDVIVKRRLMLKTSATTLALAGAILLSRVAQSEIYWIDAEGGADPDRLPERQSLLVDTANRTPRSRRQTHSRCGAAGRAEKIDILPHHSLPRRPHRRDAGAVEMILIGMYMDHGDWSN
jgi:hypothetical protein